MLLTIIKRDCKALGHQGRMLAMNVLLVLGLCCASYVVSSYSTSGTFLFGRENLQLTFVALLGVSSCVEFLGRALLSDIDDGTRTTAFFCGVNPIGYALAKAIVPLCISAIDVAVFGMVTAPLLPFPAVLPQGMVASVGACLLDLLFCIGAICLISAFSRPDKRNRPNFLVYIMGMHIPLIALCSPLNNLPLFCAVVSLAAVVAYAVYAFAMTKRHLSNIGRIDND
jgi:hypothetical protein